MSPVEALKLSDLLELFPGNGLRSEDMETVPPEEVPAPYGGLLVHEHHMTVTLERHHGRPVHLVVHDRKNHGPVYARRLVLTAGPGGRVVMAGVMRFAMTHCNETIRQEIEAERTPLGRILIAHCNLRRIETHAFLRVRLNPDLRECFGAPPSETVTYGRLAAIICGYEPTVDLLEIVAPEGPGSELHRT